jgi:hypothetical protein
MRSRKRKNRILQEGKAMHALEQSILDEPIFSIPDGAKAIGLSESALWIAFREGKLAKTRILGRVFVRRSELRKLIVDERTK